ncbi:MAG: UDP-N-acetylmuramate--L-alanine ligase [Bacteroidota bacterium]|nr:UDP-N-acetylmuramate--L-alanine ligase [Bacteroidota bacterium]
MEQYKYIYFLGIGGIGMSALARYFNTLGKVVCGYDRTATDITQQLQSQGVRITYNQEVEALPLGLTPQNTLVVITPAIPKEHQQWRYFTENDYTIIKRAELLGIITKDTYCFAVAGTHGKTTTSSILAHILYQSGVDVTAFVGGIVENYQSNLIGNGTTVTVVEADEFDRSFMHLYPDMACITSVDADHLDIYGDEAAIRKTFSDFAQKIPNTENLFTPTAVPIASTKVGFSPQDQVQIVDASIHDGVHHFSILYKTEKFDDFKFHLPGKHNLSNAVLASAMALNYGVSVANVRKALESFKGIKRRFSYKIKKDNLVLIDDYAHHPTEIDAVYQAVKELYPSKENMIVFQPHLFSRTKDFFEGFVQSLSRFDKVWLLDIYPAREQPIEGVSSSGLLEALPNKDKRLVTKQELIDQIAGVSAKVIAMVGAGDIGELVTQVQEKLSEKDE